MGSGRFAQALGIETGLDPSVKLLELARQRGINTFQGKGEEQIFSAASFGTVFLIVTFCFVEAPLKVLKETNRILVAGGKLVLGLVVRESPWGKFYEQQKKQGHRFYKYATFYTYEEVVGLLGQAGFAVERVISTLFQKPDTVKKVELPKEGYYPDAGFLVIMAGKNGG